VLEVGDETRLERTLAPDTLPRCRASLCHFPIVIEEGDCLGFVGSGSALADALERWVLDALDAGAARPANLKAGIDRFAAL
jgi:hypothetical protein